MKKTLIRTCLGMLTLALATTMHAGAEQESETPQEVLINEGSITQLINRVDRQVSSLGILRTEVQALREKVADLKAALDTQEVLLQTIPQVAEIVSKNATWSMTWTKQAEMIMTDLDKRMKALESGLATEIDFRITYRILLMDRTLMPAYATGVLRFYVRLQLHGSQWFFAKIIYVGKHLRLP